MTELKDCTDADRLGDCLNRAQIERLRALNADMLAALQTIGDWKNVRNNLAGQHAVHLLDVIESITDVARAAIAIAAARKTA